MFKYRVCKKKFSVMLKKLIHKKFFLKNIKKLIQQEFMQIYIACNLVQKLLKKFYKFTLYVLKFCNKYTGRLISIKYRIFYRF